jgi:predicted ATPase
MNDISKIHNEVYDLLIQQQRADPSLYYTLRKSNRDGRLEKGYWFYGNDGYLAVSFWTGMDWKNRTPNIIFVILVNGETYLEINTSDSDEKRKFVVQNLVQPLGLVPSGQRYRKDYEGFNEDYKASLLAFLKSDKLRIDEIIKQNSSLFDSKHFPIHFIDPTEFEEQKNKIERYRAVHPEKTNESTKGSLIKIKEFEIENYGPIRTIKITDIPFSSQWIFFTGENGTGKTSILRALATTICQRRVDPEELPPEGKFKTNLTFYSSNQRTASFDRVENNGIETRSLLTHGFASYGQSRLKTNHTGLSSSILNTIKFDDIFLSLFNDDTYLIDLQSQFNKWSYTNPSNYDKRKDYIKEILTDVLPNLYDIDFNDKIGDIPATSYLEKDNEEGVFRKVTFNKLASGLKSMIAMIGDILVRLYDQQPEIPDPSEFTGIILIDEIDIHLHPKLQKQLVQQLTKTFPKIQFIVTTHSPIPFLGAPKNSQIYRVTRNTISGVEVKRLDQRLELGDLLPNTILTSPIFGLDDIIPDSHKAENFIRTETNYRELELNDFIKKKIDDFVTDAKEQQLINLFKSRRK